MTYTALFLTIAMIILGIYDAIMVTFWGVDYSISRYIQNTAMNSPIFSFGFGCLAGHLFMYLRPNEFSLIFTPEEIKVLDEICAKQELTRQQALRQALRLYQLNVFPPPQLPPLKKDHNDG